MFHLNGFVTCRQWLGLLSLLACLHSASSFLPDLMEMLVRDVDHDNLRSIVTSRMCNGQLVTNQSAGPALMKYSFLNLYLDGSMVAYYEFPQMFVCWRSCFRLNEPC